MTSDCEKMSKEKHEIYLEQFCQNIELLKDNVAEMLDRLYPSSKIIILPAISNSISKYTEEELITSFIKSSYPFWMNILNRDEEFLEGNLNIIFPIADPNIMSILVNLWKTKFEADDKDLIWDFIHAFVKKSILYIHYHRYPVIKDGKICYPKNCYMREIEAADGSKIPVAISTYAQYFNVKLIE